MARSSNREAVAARPDIFAHHDYREFLKAWFGFRKRSERGFSLRSLARKAGLSAAYLPLVLKEDRSLSADGLSRINPHLGLKEGERDYLELLRELGEAHTAPQRLEAVQRMQKYREYRSLNSKEVEAYRYLSHWYYVAIRELAAVPGFKTDPDWIRRRLGGRVSSSEAREALEFLLDRGYLERSGSEGARQTKKNVECVGGVYRVALGQFHREMLRLVEELLSEVESERRTVQGYTMAIPAERFGEVKAILDEAMAKIESLNDRPGRTDTVYHVEVVAVPLTEPEKEEV